MNKDIRLEVTFKGHRKRRRLRVLLGPDATDYLIDLWLTVAQDRPSGVLDGWDCTDISLAAGWTGDPEKFVSALVEAKWLDDHSNGAYHVHDWPDHQPWVVGAPERSEKARLGGKAKAAKYSKPAQSLLNSASSSDKQSLSTAQSLLNSAPSPSPSPKPKDLTLYNPPKKGDRISKTLSQVQSSLFDTFWKAYPQKKSKGQAEKAFKKAQVDEQLLTLIVAALERAKKSPGWLKDGGQFIPYPATWLNARGWEDEIQHPKEENGDKRFPTTYDSPEEIVRWHLARQAKVGNPMGGGSTEATGIQESKS